MRKREEHRYIFRLHNGSGPWPCAYCGELVHDVTALGGKRTVVIHHKDNNPENNDPVNLTAMHRSCHHKHHNTGVVPITAGKANSKAVAESNRRRWKTNPWDMPKQPIQRCDEGCTCGRHCR